MFLQSQLEERLVFLGLDSFDGTAEGSLTRFELCRLPFCTCLKRSGQNDRYYVPLSHFNAEDEEGNSFVVLVRALMQHRARPR